MIRIKKFLVEMITRSKIPKTNYLKLPKTKYLKQNTSKQILSTKNHGCQGAWPVSILHLQMYVRNFKQLLKPVVRIENNLAEKVISVTLYKNS